MATPQRSVCYVVGRKAVMASNNHQYIAEPYTVFLSESDAMAAADLVERVSGERPLIVEAALYSPDHP